MAANPSFPSHDGPQSKEHFSGDYVPKEALPTNLASLRSVRARLHSEVVNILEAVNLTFAQFSNWDSQQNIVGDVYGYGTTVQPPLYYDSRNRGEVQAVYLQWEQLKILRDQSRQLCASNEFAVAGLENRQNYVVGDKGLAVRLLPNDPKNKRAVELSKKGQHLIDVTRQINNAVELELWCMRSLDECGEFFVRLFPRSDGFTDLRSVEPEHVKPPPSGAWAPETSFGVKTDPNDVQKKLAYYCLTDPLYDQLNGEWVPAEEIVHRTLNVSVNAKRGLPTYYQVMANLRRCEDLQASMTSMAKARAKIALIRQIDGLTNSTADTLLASLTDATVTNPISQSQTNIEKFDYGTILTTSGNTKYEMPGLALGAQDLVEVLQSELRAVATRLQMPEWMFTAKADAKYDNAFIGEGPVLKAFKKLQRIFTSSFGENRYGANASVYWKCLRNAVRAGLIDNDVLHLCRIDCTGPSLESRDKSSESQTNERYRGMGVKSIATIRDEQGLDDDEKRKVIEEMAVNYLTSDQLTQLRSIQQMVYSGQMPHPAGLASLTVGMQVPEEKARQLLPEPPPQPAQPQGAGATMPPGGPPQAPAAADPNDPNSQPAPTGGPDAAGLPGQQPATPGSGTLTAPGGSPGDGQAQGSEVSSLLAHAPIGMDTGELEKSFDEAAASKPPETQAADAVTGTVLGSLGVPPEAQGEEPTDKNVTESVDIEVPTGCVMVNLAGDDLAYCRKLSSMIRAGDYIRDGREAVPHVTIRHGLLGVEPHDVRLMLSDCAVWPFTLSGKVDAFRGAESGRDYDVLYIPVKQAGELHDAHADLGLFDCIDAFPEYTPHVTLGYVKAGLADHYIAALSAACAKRVVTRGELVYADPYDDLWSIRFSDEPTADGVARECVVVDYLDDGDSLIEATNALGGSRAVQSQIARQHFTGQVRDALGRVYNFVDGVRQKAAQKAGQAVRAATSPIRNVHQNIKQAGGYGQMARGFLGKDGLSGLLGDVAKGANASAGRTLTATRNFGVKAGAARAATEVARSPLGVMAEGLANSSPVRAVASVVDAVKNGKVDDWIEGKVKVAWPHAMVVGLSGVVSNIFGGDRHAMERFALSEKTEERRAHVSHEDELKGAIAKKRAQLGRDVAAANWAKKAAKWHSARVAAKLGISQDDAEFKLAFLFRDMAKKLLDHQASGGSANAKAVGTLSGFGKFTIRKGDGSQRKAVQDFMSHETGRVHESMTWDDTTILECNTLLVDDEDSLLEHGFTGRVVDSLNRVYYYVDGRRVKAPDRDAQGQPIDRMSRRAAHFALIQKKQIATAHIQNMLSGKGISNASMEQFKESLEHFTSSELKTIATALGRSVKKLDKTGIMEAVGMMFPPPLPDAKIDQSKRDDAIAQSKLEFAATLKKFNSGQIVGRDGVEALSQAFAGLSPDDMNAVAKSFGYANKGGTDDFAQRLAGAMERNRPAEAKHALPPDAGHVLSLHKSGDDPAKVLEEFKARGGTAQSMHEHIYPLRSFLDERGERRSFNNKHFSRNVPEAEQKARDAISAALAGPITARPHEGIVPFNDAERAADAKSERQSQELFNATREVIPQDARGGAEIAFDDTKAKPPQEIVANLERLKAEWAKDGDKLPDEYERKLATAKAAVAKDGGSESAGKAETSANSKADKTNATAPSLFGDGVGHQIDDVPQQAANESEQSVGNDTPVQSGMGKVRSKPQPGQRSLFGNLEDDDAKRERAEKYSKAAKEADKQAIAAVNDSPSEAAAKIKTAKRMRKLAGAAAKEADNNSNPEGAAQKAATINGNDQQAGQTAGSDGSLQSQLDGTRDGSPSERVSTGEQLGADAGAASGSVLSRSSERTEPQGRTGSVPASADEPSAERVFGHGGPGDAADHGPRVSSGVVAADPAGRDRPARGVGAGSSGVRPDGRNDAIVDQSPAEQSLAQPSSHDNPTGAGVPNFQYTDSQFVARGQKAKYLANIAAIRTLQAIRAEGRDHATPEEQQILSRYTGWGQFPQLFNYNWEWRKEAEELRGLLDSDEFDAARKSTLNAHYTHPDIVKLHWDLAKRLGFDGGRYLEPSAGIGYYLGMMPDDLAGKTHSTAVELDPTTGGMLGHLYPNHRVKVQGFEKFQSPDNFYDLVASNVPFGDYKIHDPRYNKHGANIHDYFFLKSADLTRPGGLVMHITSTGTMDKSDSSIRDELAKQFDLVGALRFPADAHKDNAGTSVVTDMLLLRKRLPGEEAGQNAWSKVTTVPDPDGGEAIPVNEYFVNNPHHILGRLDRSGTMYRGDSKNVSKTDDYEHRLAAAIESLPRNVMAARQTSDAKFAVAPKRIEADTGTKQGGYVHRDGKIFVRQGGDLVEQDLPAATANKIRDHLAIRDAFYGVIDAQRSGGDSDTARQVLNRTYDRFVAKYGPLNDRSNKLAFRDDPDSPTLLALEKYDHKSKSASKTDVFHRDTIRKVEPVTSVGTPEEAVGVSLHETGGIHIGRIVELTGKSHDEIERHLSATGLAYHDPSEGWLHADNYLSGNVRKKLATARAAAETDKRFLANVAALERVQPEDLDYSDISAKLGAPWIPASDVADFAGELMGTGSDHFSIRYLPHNGTWQANFSNEGKRRNTDYSKASTELYGTTDRNFGDVLEAALNNTPITISRKMSDGSSVVDREATDAVNAKIAEVKEKFGEWLWTHDERRERLHRAYNDTYNNTVPFKANGQHLKFPGMSPDVELRPHQKDFVWHTITKGVGLAAHEVGTGKTLSLIASAMELRRLGLARKPAIACLKANMEAIAAEARRAYPGAKILTTEGVKNAEDRNRIMSQIATGDHDLVIVTHDNLDMMKMKPETVQQHIQEELRELEAAKSEMESSGVKKNDRGMKAMEKAKANLEAKLQEAMDESKKDNALSFEDSGIDHLFVDESHKYRSLPVYTKQYRMKGVPTSRSDRATNMLMRTRWLMENNGGRGVTFATGTPIANTMAEMYTLQRYLQPHELKEKNVGAFDAWSNVYGDVHTKMETTVTGEYKPVSRFAKFVNVPELMQSVRQVMDVQRADAMKKPDGSPVITRPKRNLTVDVAPQSPELAKLMTTLQERAQEIKSNRDSTDNMLVICTDGRKGALDMRLLDANAEDNPDSKLNRAINNVLSIHKARPNVTQMIFSDLGVHPTEDGFHLYQDVIDKLVAGGIPREKIADFSKLENEKKDRAVEGLRRGDILIGLGSTDKLGTGVNAQDKLAAIHHLDAPWLPSSVEQRDGRGWRQGNMNDPTKAAKDQVVGLHRYVTEKSLDQLFWQTLSTKAKFINQVMTPGGKIDRVIRDDDTEELSHEQIMAAASGDPRILAKVQLDDDLKNLAKAKTRHENDQYKLKSSLASSERMIPNMEKELAEKRADAATVESHDKDKFLLKLENGHSFTERKDANDALDSLRAETRDNGYGTRIGEFRGLGIYKNGEKLELRSKTTGQSYPTGASLQSIEYVARNLGKTAEDYAKEVDRKRGEIESLKQHIGKPFAKQAEYEEKHARLKRLEDSLAGRELPSGYSEGDRVELLDGRTGVIKNAEPDKMVRMSIDGGIEHALVGHDMFPRREPPKSNDDLPGGNDSDNGGNVPSPDSPEPVAPTGGGQVAAEPGQDAGHSASNQPATEVSLGGVDDKQPFRLTDHDMTNPDLNQVLQKPQVSNAELKQEVLKHRAETADQHAGWEQHASANGFTPEQVEQLRGQTRGKDGVVVVGPKAARFHDAFHVLAAGRTAEKLRDELKLKKGESAYVVKNATAEGDARHAKFIKDVTAYGVWSTPGQHTPRQEQALKDLVAQGKLTVRKGRGPDEVAWGGVVPDVYEPVKAAEPAPVNAPVARNWTAGPNRGEVKFESELHRDLYDIGAADRYASRGGQNKTSDRADRDTSEQIARISRQLGIAPHEVKKLALDTHSSVKEQMKGMKDGESRAVTAAIPAAPGKMKFNEYIESISDELADAEGEIHNKASNIIDGKARAAFIKREVDSLRNAKYKVYEESRNEIARQATGQAIAGMRSGGAATGGDPVRNNGQDSLQGAGNSPAKKVGYFKGDAGEYTGRTEQGASGRLHEIKMTEGQHKGEMRLVADGPDGSNDTVEAKQAGYREQQAGFKRLADAQKATAVSAGTPDIAAGGPDAGRGDKPSGNAGQDHAAKLLDALKSGKRHFEDLKFRSGLSHSDTANGLLRLELDRKVRRLPGGYFEPNPDSIGVGVGDAVIYTGRGANPDDKVELRGYHSHGETGEKMARVIFRPKTGTPYESSVALSDIKKAPPVKVSEKPERTNDSVRVDNTNWDNHHPNLSAMVVDGESGKVKGMELLGKKVIGTGVTTVDGKRYRNYVREAYGKKEYTYDGGNTWSSDKQKAFEDRAKEFEFVVPDSGFDTGPTAVSEASKGLSGDNSDSPLEMTREEWALRQVPAKAPKTSPEWRREIDARAKSRDEHRNAVASALANGKTVSRRVIADYPDLATKYRDLNKPDDDSSGQPARIDTPDGTQPGGTSLDTETVARNEKLKALDAKMAEARRESRNRANSKPDRASWVRHLFDLEHEYDSIAGVGASGRTLEQNERETEAANRVLDSKYGDKNEAYEQLKKLDAERPIMQSRYLDQHLERLGKRIAKLDEANTWAKHVENSQGKIRWDSQMETVYGSVKEAIESGIPARLFAYGPEVEEAIRSGVPRMSFGQSAQKKTNGDLPDADEKASSIDQIAQTMEGEGLLRTPSDRHPHDYLLEKLASGETFDGTADDLRNRLAAEKDGLERERDGTAETDAKLIQSIREGRRGAGAAKQPTDLFGDPQPVLAGARSQPASTVAAESPHAPEGQPQASLADIMKQAAKMGIGGGGSDVAELGGEEPESIADFGEMIPGARKHTAVQTGKGGGGKAEEGESMPAWRRPYDVAQDAKNGRWFVTKRGSPLLPTWAGGKDYATKEEAESTIAESAVRQSHGTVNKGDINNPNIVIYRKVSDRKLPTVKGGFTSHEEAEKYMRDHPEEILNHEFPDWQDYSYLDNVRREGPQHHVGDVKTSDFQEAFGFRGGQFGNWQTNKDGQTSLNHAYDSLHDLASVTGLRPKDLSLGGKLAIAFGARGHGGMHSAKAHYEPDRAVINLTKMKGAGSLAHEWFHALDHELAKKEFGDKHSKLLTQGVPYAGREANKDIVQAWRNLVDLMQSKVVSQVADAGKVEKARDAHQESINRDVASIEDRLAGEQRYNKRFKPLSEQQQKVWDDLTAKIRAGEFGSDTTVETKSTSRFASDIPTTENLKKLNDLYKSATGRSFITSDASSVGRSLYSGIQRKKLADKRIADSHGGKAEQRKVRTDYYNNAVDLDRTRVKNYFAEPEEMAARAFQSYVEDKLSERGHRSDYLSAKAANHHYTMIDAKPFPEGEERSVINAAFDRLFAAVRQYNDANRKPDDSPSETRMAKLVRNTGSGGTVTSEDRALLSDLASDGKSTMRARWAGLRGGHQSFANEAEKPLPHRHSPPIVDPAAAQALNVIKRQRGVGEVPT